MLLSGCGPSPRKPETGPSTNRAPAEARRCSEGDATELAVENTLAPEGSCPNIDPSWAIRIVSAPSRATPCSGDVVEFFNYHFVWRDGWRDLKHDGKDVYAIGPDGKTVAAVLSNGLDYDRWPKVTEEELGALGGVDLWNSRHIGRLKAIDPSRTCISIHGEDDLVGAPDNIFQTTCLDIDGHTEDPTHIARFKRLKTLVLGLNVSRTDAILRNVSAPQYLETLVVSEQPRATALARFERLRVLRIDGLAGAPLDLAPLASLHNLQELRVSGLIVENLHGLSCLNKLARLDLGRIKGDQDLSALATLSSLTHLEVNGEVADLSPLAPLQRLKSVKADFTSVSKLPSSSMPSLEELSVMSTPLGDDAAAAFAKANPQCRIKHRYVDVLRQELAAADAVKISSSRGCVEDKTRVLSIPGPTAGEVLESIEVKEPEDARWVACEGDILFEFHGINGKLLGRLEYFSRPGLMNFHAWPATVELTPKSKARLDALIFAQPTP